MHDAHPVSSSALSGEGWSASVTWGADDIHSLNPSRLSQACFEGRCVAYFRKCETTNRCRFIFDRGKEQELVLAIEAKSAEGMTRALGSLAYLPTKDDITSRVPLTAFDQPSSVVSPYCGRKRGSEGQVIWDKGCEFEND